VQLVVRPGINTAQDLRGKTLASPELGNTQDVALRAWLTSQGLRNSIRGGGDVTITTTKNADTLQLVRSGKLDGAWVPEPWASRLVLEAGGKVLVNERDLWPGGQFVTTQLIVRTEFLARYPQTVEALLRGHVDAVQWATQNSAEAKTVVNDGLNTLAGKPLTPEVVDRAWQNLTVTDDPVAASLQRSAENAEAYRKAFPKGPPFFTAASSFRGSKRDDPHFRLSRALHVADWNHHDEASVKLIHEAGGDWAFYNGGTRWTYGVYLYKAAKQFDVKFRISWHWNAAAGDPFYGLDCREDDYAWCYTNPDREQLSTPHFERLREGLDDYRRLLTLTRLAKEQADTPAARDAEKFLAGILGLQLAGLTVNIVVLFSLILAVTMGRRKRAAWI